MKADDIFLERHNEFIYGFPVSEPPPVPFSVPDYLDRMEKLHLKALQERENEETHIIVLWWGFDGLRLNADGTREWIDRRPKKRDPAPKSFIDLLQPATVPAYPSWNEIPTSTLDSTLLTQQINCSIAAQTAALQSQLQAVNYESWLTQQTQNAINQYVPTRDRNVRLRR